MTQHLHEDQLLLDAMALVTAETPAVAILGDDSRVCSVIGDEEIRAALASGAAPGTSLRSISSRDFVVASSEGEKDAFLASGSRYLVELTDSREVSAVTDRRYLSAGDDVPLSHAVIMVGGAGSRLEPLTDSVPKPMLPIGGTPLLRRIVDHVKGHGIRRVTMALGYLGEQIVEYFGDGAEMGLEIDYVHEEKPMGTAGALGMVSRDAARPLLVMNGDILTGLNIRSMAFAHKESGATMTIASRVHQQEIPYGVFNLIDGRVVAVEEKPTRSSWTNAGIYIINPSALDLVPANHYSDMTLLIEKLVSRGDVVRAHCLWESWVDIGCPDDYERAKKSDS